MIRSSFRLTGGIRGSGPLGIDSVLTLTGGAISVRGTGALIGDNALTLASSYGSSGGLTNSLVLTTGGGNEPSVFWYGAGLWNVTYGADPIIGTLGGDWLTGTDSAQSLLGDAGNDVIWAEGGNDVVLGDAGVDFLVGGIGNDFVLGGDGSDAIFGGDGNDILIGGSDFSTDIVVGGDGNDIIDAASGLGDYDILNGGSGDDLYFVDTPADITYEAADGGTDAVFANIVGAGYYLFAHVENLFLMGTTPFGVGNALDNRLIGSASGNWLLGGDGNDTIGGGAGGDVLFGEAGADIFVFERGTGGDVVGDFQPGTDVIDLKDFGFANFAALQANLVENGGTTAIDLGQGDFVVLNGVTNAQLSAADFVFG